MPYDYSVAKDLLSETEKNRIVAMYLNCDEKAFNSIVNWDAATTQFGASSVDSMKVSVRNITKKLEKSGGKLEDGAEASPAKPAKTPTPRKRKGKASTDEDVDSPKTKKGRERPKKKEESAKAEDEATAKGAVKDEEGEDE